MHDLPAEVPAIWHSPSHQIATRKDEHDKQWRNLVLADAPYADEFLAAYADAGTRTRRHRTILIKTRKPRRKAKAKRPKPPKKQLSLFPQDTDS